MTIYYFHLRDGDDVLLDPEGIELPNNDAIVARALSEARHLMSEDVLTGVLDLAQRIDVEDEDGQVVHRLWLGDALAIRYPAENEASSRRSDLHAS